MDMLIVPFVIILFLIYGAVILLVGRVLIYNDVFRRKMPNTKGIEHLNLEEIDLLSPDGIKLKGWFIKSKNNPENRTLILIHGWLNSRQTLKRHIKLFVESGFHVLAYDQRSHGESGTGMITFGPAEARDLTALIDYAEKNKNINMEQLGAVGFSLGTGGLIYAVAHNYKNTFRAIVLEGIFANSFDCGNYILEKKFGLFLAKIIGSAVFLAGSKIVSFGRFRHSEPAQYVSHIAPTPLMIIRGKNDNMIPEYSARKFIKNINNPSKMWFTEKGSHISSLKTYPDEYKNQVLDFLNEHLSTNSESVADQKYKEKFHCSSPNVENKEIKGTPSYMAPGLWLGGKVTRI